MNGRQAHLDASFNELFAASVDETISGILGKTVSAAFTIRMQNTIGSEIQDVQNRPEDFFKILHSAFGTGGDRLGRYIVRKLYQKSGVDFPENDGQTLTEYVQALKTTLTYREVQANE